MKKLYYHSEIVYRDGKFVCNACGEEVDEFLRSTNPCVIPTTSATVIDNLPVLISVYNCVAFLVAEVSKEDGGVLVVSFDYDDSIADQLERLLERDIEMAGGAINMSGYYPLSDKTARRIQKWFREGKLWLDI